MADNVNQLFVYTIKKYIPKPEIIDLFTELITEELNDQTNNIQDDSKHLGMQIKELQEKIVYIKELLSSKQIEPADFREMKSEYSTKLERLEAKLNASNDYQVDIKELLDKVVKPTCSCNVPKAASIFGQCYQSENNLLYRWVYSFLYKGEEATKFTF